ncbi:MAG: hypothetical protein WAN10_16805 [Candidatus Acidiferrales bacterium]
MKLGQLAQQLVAVFVIPLLAVPMYAATESANILGVVTNTQLATVASASLADGTNIFDGDVISTADRGSAWVTLPDGAGILLGQDSEAQIRRESPNGPIIFDIAQGEVRFRSTDKTVVNGFLYDATIAPAGSPTASGYVEFTSPTSAIIGAESGSLLVTTLHDGGTRYIPAGSMMEVHMVPSQDQSQQQNHTAKRRRGLIVLLGIAAIGTIAVLAIVLHHHHQTYESPSSFPQ